ncbi:hypothetical protein [Malikia sp.]|uniref:hypothetical protein n=1 Tax=Malikia sp. TaxID=2070706 RepID=UPI002628842A|nr:hypothetical protein [Malikia sp.]
MLKTKKSIIALAGLVSVLTSVPVHAQQLIDLTGSLNKTEIFPYIGDFAGVFTTAQPNYWVGSSGAGVMQPFLRVQDSPVERGINSDLKQSDLQYDESAGTWTHSLRREESSVLSGYNIPGLADPYRDKFYREFLLDVNEPDNDPSYVILSELKVYISDSPNLTGFDGKQSTLESWATTTLTDPNAGHQTIKAFDLDLKDTDTDGDLDPFDRAILLDYGLLGSGGGRPDMTVYLPRIYNPAAGTHVFFYTRFGCSTTADADYDANCQAAINLATAAGKSGVSASSGSEDWAVRQTVINQEVPAPPAILGAFAAFGYMRKLRRRLKAHQASQLAA